MKTVIKRKVRRAKKSMNPYLSSATPEQRRWLKTHTISDLEEIADTLEFQGEGIEGIRQVIEDLNTVAANLGVVVRSQAKPDLIEFATVEEAKATA